MDKNQQDPSTAIELLHHVEGLISLGENRANIVAAGNAALLVAYSSTNLLEMMFPQTGLFSPSWPAAFALVAVVFAVASLVPQLKSTIFSKSLPHNSYFFGCLGDMNENDFVEGYLKRTGDEHVRMILRAVHMRARKAKSKFTLLAVATISTIVQFLPMVGTFL